MREFDFATVPIVDIVNDIIIDGATKNASDIHFDPAEKYLKIRMRIDGELRDYAIVENKYKRNLTTRVKLLAGMNITESRLPQDGAIKSNINGKDLDLRVAALPTSFGEKIVIRILDYTMSFEGIEALGFTKENYEIIKEMLANPNGIILVTGATGSGKSTTVYSMLQRLNNEGTNIITVEDPVEMNIEGINQVQVNSEIGLDFATVLRSILREDPNVILIGEIRDSETAKIAIRASITGHLVLSTIHTNNSLTTIERLLDMDVERYLLSTSLKGIISQTLAKRLCPNCKKKRATTVAEKRIFKKALDKDIDYIYEPSNGCPNCRGGYKGRIALQEVLLINDEIRDAINENKRRAELRSMIYKKGVKTLFQDGLLKVIDGITTMEEVFRLVDVDDDLDNIYGKDESMENDVKEIIEKQLKEKGIEKENNDNITNNLIENTLDNNKIVKINEPKENNYDIKLDNFDNFFDNIENKTINNVNKQPIYEEKKQTDNSINDFINNIDKVENGNINNDNFDKFFIDTNNNNLNESNKTNYQNNNNLNNPVVENNQNEKEEQKESTSSSYTDDLINLINQGFFE